MSIGSLFALLLLLLPHSLSSQTSNAKDNSDCSLSCGNTNISFPFRLQGDPKHCGWKKYELSCEPNTTTTTSPAAAVLYLYWGKYYVLSINYNNFTIRVVDARVVDQKKGNNYFSSPRYSLTSFNFTYTDNYTDYGHYGESFKGHEIISSVPITFLMCENPMNSPVFIETAPCTMDNSSSYSYLVVGRISPFDVGESCKITQMVMVSPSNDKYMKSCEGIYHEIGRGFELSWFRYGCGKCGIDEACVYNVSGEIGCEQRYNYKEPWYQRTCDKLKGKKVFICLYARSSGLVFIFSGIYDIGIYQGAKFVLGLPFVTALLIYKWRRRHLSMYDNIEDFLQSHNNLMPVRYSYSDIKKMARGFKDKLGEGGYGIVYKAKLRSGRLVAIKILGNSKSNGQEFINEVATIGRIHHVNVVRLIGFCVEGSKRALVYDFMPNGSLEKYIFSQQGVLFLSCEKLFKISLGVARGIEYLHRGCDMQILHFDIKPHNILLDENFIPKVSDFGLARLYPLDNSIVSLTAARGTIGYIAPELFYKNIGGISYKADVYSFGMLLMEMAGRRKNLNAAIEHSSQFSQIYFPTWVSDQLREGKDIGIEDATDDENKTIKKMIMVALWCIQMKPSERPSMSKVVEMLEGEIESLQMPPKPFLYPQQMPVEDAGDNSSITLASTMTESAEISLIADEVN